jgi:site-specific recombinase XerD
MVKNNLLPKFKKKLLQQELSQNTILGYCYDINHFYQWLANIYDHQKADLDIKKILAADLKAYRQELVRVKRQKASAVNRRIQSLRRFFSWAKQSKLIHTNPAQEIRFVRRMPLARPTSLDKKEIHSLLRAAGQSAHGLAKRNYALLQLMLQAGLRIGEVVKLQYRDIDINERSGKVRIVEGKGFKEREVPLNATARRALAVYLKIREPLDSTDHLFLSKQGKTPTIRALQLIVKNLAQRAKITRINVTPHTLRHTFAASYLQSNPTGLVELAALLGHDSLNTTAIYTKASKEKLTQGVENMGVNIYDD